MVAILREIQIAEEGVMRALGGEGQCFFNRGSTVHLQLASGKALKEEAAETFFVVQYENGASFYQAQRAGRCGAGRKRGDRERSEWRLVESGGEINGECGAARGESFGFNRAAVFSYYGQTDAEAEAGAAAGALGGVKGIEEARRGFRANADAIVLERDGDAGADASKADLDAARF